MSRGRRRTCMPGFSSSWVFLLHGGHGYTETYEVLLLLDGFSRRSKGSFSMPLHAASARSALSSYKCMMQSMARVFRLMEDARKALGLQAYGVSLPTLEQVFLRVVGHELQG